MKLIVVGGGIMGLSVAWAAVRRGHRVTLVEQGPLPHPFASSYDRTRLIRYPYGPKHGYARMVTDAYAANACLWSDLGRTFAIDTGTLVLARGGDEWADATRATMERLGLAHDLLDEAEVARRYPLLRADGVAWAMVTPTGSILLARAILEALIDWLRARDEATILSHTRVGDVDLDTAEVGLEDGRRLAADRVVVAAGPWTQHLMPALRSSARPSRQVALEIDLPEPLAAAWAQMPMVLDGVAWQGTGFYAVPPIDGHLLKVGDHGFSMSGDPDGNRIVNTAEREHIRSMLAAGVRDPDAYRVASARSCFYTVAEGERFVVDEHVGGLALTGFSGHGFKFGPLVGLATMARLDDRIAAQAFAHWLGGNQEADDQPARPDALASDLALL
ncbi:MAG: FAD-dependent oxidoreductase [Pseudomonadota bacterium]